MGVGIDIGSKTIKVVDLEKRGDKFFLKASGIIGYTGQPPELATNDKELSELSAILKKLTRETRISTKKVTVALPEHQVFTRLIKFPPLNDQEIASAIKWEAEQYIPIPVTDAIVQHTIVQRNETAVKPSVSVFLVAVSKEISSRYVKVVQDAGIVVTAVEPAMIALARAISPKTGASVLVDIGSYSTNVGIVSDSNLVFSRSIPTAGNAFNRAVSQQLGVDPAQSEEYKKTYGLQKDKLEGKVRNSLMPVVLILADEIKKALHFFKTEEASIVPSTVYISGGSANLPGLIGELSAILSMEVAAGNPFSDVAVDANEQKNVSAYASLYAVAMGLAKRD